MSEVEISFEREGVAGIVAAGCYLNDAAKRFGVRQQTDCAPETGEHYCRVSVTAGSELLSPPTEVEKAFFAANEHDDAERLGCQTKIERSGEVVVMTKKEEPEEEPETQKEKDEKYRKEFAELPLEKKIYELVHLEAIAFSETISFVVNSPFKVADKLMDVMAEFGFRRETAQKAAKRPEEHGEAKTEAAETGGKKAKRSDKNA